MGTEPTQKVGKFEVITEAESTAGNPPNQTEVAEATAENDETSHLTLGVTESAPKKRGRPKGTTNSTTRARSQLSVAEYRMWAQTMLNTSNIVVVTWLGPECGMHKAEGEMMEQPLARMLERMPASAAGKAGQFLDPMVLLIGLGMWTKRILTVQREKQTPQIPPMEVVRAAGVSGTELTPDNEKPNRTSSRKRMPKDDGTPVPLVPRYESPPEPDDYPIPPFPLNGNGVPVAITQSIGEV